MREGKVESKLKLGDVIYTLGPMCIRGPRNRGAGLGLIGTRKCKVSCGVGSWELPACALWPPDFFSSAQRRGLERVHSKSSYDLPLPHLL
jgi:hypothetical protein